MRERWREVLGFPMYQISERGEVVNVVRRRSVAPRFNNEGFLMVTLFRDGTRWTRSVAMLVVDSFNMHNPDPFIYNSVIHRDADRSNCELSNLARRPRWFAIEYHRQFDYPCPYSCGLYCETTGEEFESIREAALKYGLVEERIWDDTVNRYGVFPQGYLFSRLQKGV